MNFKDLIDSIMEKRWRITIIVLGTFAIIAFAILISIHTDTKIGAEWKELLIFMLGAFVSSYGKIIDYWFTDHEKDKILVQKMDEEDGLALSNVNHNEEEHDDYEKVEIDEDGDGVNDGYDNDGDGKIDEYFEHRNCEHVWGDVNSDGEEECLKCGKIKEPEQ